MAHERGQATGCSLGVRLAAAVPLGQLQPGLMCGLASVRMRNNAEDQIWSWPRELVGSPKSKLRDCGGSIDLEAV